MFLCDVSAEDEVDGGLLLGEICEGGVVLRGCPAQGKRNVLGIKNRDSPSLRQCMAGCRVFLKKWKKLCAAVQNKADKCNYGNGIQSLFGLLPILSAEKLLDKKYAFFHAVEEINACF